MPSAGLAPAAGVEDLTTRGGGRLPSRGRGRRTVPSSHAAAFSAVCLRPAGQSCRTRVAGRSGRTSRHEPNRPPGRPRANRSSQGGERRLIGAGEAAIGATGAPFEFEVVDLEILVEGITEGEGVERLRPGRPGRWRRRRQRCRPCPSLRRASSQIEASLQDMSLDLSCNQLQLPAAKRSRLRLPTSLVRRRKSAIRVSSAAVKRLARDASQSAANGPQIRSARA